MPKPPAFPPTRLLKDVSHGITKVGRHYGCPTIRVWTRGTEEEPTSVEEVVTAVLQCAADSQCLQKPYVTIRSAVPGWDPLNCPEVPPLIRRLKEEKFYVIVETVLVRFDPSLIGDVDFWRVMASHGVTSLIALKDLHWAVYFNLPGFSRTPNVAEVGRRLGTMERRLELVLGGEADDLNTMAFLKFHYENIRTNFLDEGLPLSEVFFPGLVFINNYGNAMREGRKLYRAAGWREFSD